MPTCPECAQLLPPEVMRCPACGHTRTRRLEPHESVDDHDEERDRDELLAAAIAQEAIDGPPPAWAGRGDAAGGLPSIPPRKPEGEGDVLPEPSRRWSWRRKR